jgi:hypothetical protein
MLLKAAAVLDAVGGTLVASPAPATLATRP